MIEAELLERLRSERTNPELYDRLGDLYSGDPALVDKALRNYLEAARLLLGGAGPDRRERAARAAEVLGKAVPLAAERDTVLYRLAEALETAARPADAEAVYRDLLLRSLPDDRPFFHLALLERVAALAPLDFAHRRHTAATRERLGMHASAARELAEIARLEARQGAAGPALEDIARSLELLPQAPELFEAKAEVLELLGDRESAARAWLEAADAHRKGGDEGRGRLAAERVLVPGEAPLPAAVPVSGVALFLLDDPLLLGHAESLVRGLGLQPARATSDPSRELPPGVRIAVLGTAALNDRAAWDEVVELRRATRPDLPVIVVESAERLLGEEDRRRLDAAAIPLVSGSDPFPSLAAPLLAAISRLPPDAAADAEPLLPFVELPNLARPGGDRPAAATDADAASSPASRWSDVEQIVGALQDDAVRHEAEIEGLRAELQAWREARVAEEGLAGRIRSLEERLAAREREVETQRLELAARAAELDRSRLAAGAAEALVRERTADRDRLRDELSARGAKAAELEARAAVQAAELEVTTAALERVETELKGQLAQQAAEQSRGAGQAAAAELERASARERLADEVRRVSELFQEAKTLGERLAEAASERSELGERLERSRREAEQAAASARAAERQRLDSQGIEQARRIRLAGLWATSSHELERELGEARARGETAEAALRTRQAEIEQARHRAEALATSRGELERERDQAQDERDQLRRELAVEGRRREQSEQDLAARQREAALLGAERERLAAERDALAAEHDALAAEHDALAAERDAAVRARDSLGRQLETAREGGERLRAGEAEARAAAGALEGRLGASEAERVEILRRLASSEEDATGWRKQAEGSAEALLALRVSRDADRHEAAAERGRAQGLAGELGAERAARLTAEAAAAGATAALLASSARLSEVEGRVARLDEEVVARARAEQAARAEAERADLALAAATARAALLDRQIEELRATALTAQREGARAASERDLLQSEMGLAGERMRKLEAALSGASDAALLSDGEQWQLREELGRASAELSRRRQEEALRARRGWLARFADRALPLHPFGQGLLVGLLSVTVSLAALTWLRPRQVSLGEAGGEAPGVVPERTEPAPESRPDSGVTAAATAAPETAGAGLEEPTAAVRPINLAAYADLERGLVRRQEKPGYRVTAKLRTPDEVRGFYAYQASLKGWDEARLKQELDGPGGALSRFRFAERTYIDVLAENLGYPGPFDVNAIAQSFALAVPGGELRGFLNPSEEPKVVTSSSDGPPRIQAVTLSLVYARPTRLPVELSFHLRGARSEAATLVWEAAP